ncbi:pyridoxal phosphate-dependent aminotransferase family protein [Paralimibaculum aggregatum]|uniref:Pyridoxal phosphate-dependent aminotransferase family protein n=1 Tax=Paralimibaculum aggregatum TaxID=3036245 RepID=A0ABQ6LJG0_9RHOB|nr:aminotransferase class I/II-fold pyridoxal phosphate-dependent enzyme [Limibaculum sp. NKW23]GMG80804.1 pyridoxal phosphate-dependent aminotransferase family protein [Limibaculum sp. NKW23]
MSGRAEGAALVARLRAQAAARPAPGPADAADTTPAPAGADYDFEDLPEHRPIRLQLAALESLGLEHPFYRLNESGPTTAPVIEGRPQLSFASYDYLGLNAHPELIAAARDAVARWGVSASASRLVGGERAHHRQLEAALAKMQGTEDCVVFVSGHATNVTGIGALMGPQDLILHDALAHNSVTVGAQLSGAARLTMPHNDLDWLEDSLARRRGDFRHVLIAVEGLYSMDGDIPDLARLVEIKRRHGAWLMVDEAHSLGVLGATGRGLAEHCGVPPAAVDIWMGTLSKTLASCGGYICGQAALVRHLKARASGFVFSVALAAPLAAAATTALALMAREPERVARLQARAARFRDRARAAGIDTGLGQGFAVMPVMVGDSLRALRASAALFERGIYALPIVHPAVPERQARLRFFITAEHTEAEIDRAVAETAAALSAL